MLAVRNFDRFQHYHDRRPSWVKLYVSLLQDKEQRSLTPTTRLIYMLLLLVAANRDNEIPDDAAWLSVETGLPRAMTKRALEELIEHNFLIFASEASRASFKTVDTRPSAETETEKESSSAEAVETNGAGLKADLELAVARLLDSLKDKDERTHLVVRGIVTSGKLAVGDVEWARECAHGPGVISQTRVAVAELKKRAVVA